MAGIKKFSDLQLVEGDPENPESSCCICLEGLTVGCKYSDNIYHITCLLTLTTLTGDVEEIQGFSEASDMTRVLILSELETLSSTQSSSGSSLSPSTSRSDYMANGDGQQSSAHGQPAPSPQSSSSAAIDGGDTTASTSSSAVASGDASSHMDTSDAFQPLSHNALPSPPSQQQQSDASSSSNNKVTALPNYLPAAQMRPRSTSASTRSGASSSSPSSTPRHAPYYIPWSSNSSASHPQPSSSPASQHKQSNSSVSQPQQSNSSISQPQQNSALPLHWSAAQWAQSMGYSANGPSGASAGASISTTSSLLGPPPGFPPGGPVGPALPVGVGPFLGGPVVPPQVGLQRVMSQAGLPIVAAQGGPVGTTQGGSVGPAQGGPPSSIYSSIASTANNSMASYAAAVNSYNATVGNPYSVPSVSTFNMFPTSASGPVANSSQYSGIWSGIPPQFSLPPAGAQLTPAQQQQLMSSLLVPGGLPGVPGFSTTAGVAPSSIATFQSYISGVRTRLAGSMNGTGTAAKTREEKRNQTQEDYQNQSAHLAVVRGILLKHEALWPLLNKMLVDMNRTTITDGVLAVENLVDLIVYGLPKRCVCGGEVRYSEKHQTYMCVKNAIMTPSLAETPQSNSRSYGYPMHGYPCRFSDKNPQRDAFEMPAVHAADDRLQWFPMYMANSFPFRAYEDADMRRECESTGGRMLVKRGTVVDGQFLEASQCHLLKGNDGGLCSAVLVYCDVRGDTNNFIKLQLYEHDVETVAYLYVSSGRIGAKKCVVDRDTYEERDQAEGQFEKLFLEYTGNEWKNRKSFVPNPGMMMYLEMDYSACTKQLHKHLGVGEAVLHPDVRNLVETIYAGAGHSAAVRTASFKLDLEMTPLGPLAKEHITEAFEILSELEQILDASKPNMAKVHQASTQFYTVFPTSFGDEPMRPIDSLEILVEKSSLLQALDDIIYEFEVSEPPASAEAAAKKPSPYNQHGYHRDYYYNPRDRYSIAGMSTEQLYNRLKCDIQVVDHDSDEFRNIQKYLHNTSSSSGLRLVDLFRLKRHREHVTFRSTLGNRLLLWHGSSVLNLPGILSEGLKINPPSCVQRSGSIYGRGVYFADTADKSQHYCRANGFDNFLLLSDVALGRIQFTNGRDQNERMCTENFDSYLGGSGTLAEPAKVIQHPDGYGIPIHTTQQSHPNEYIVFNSDQVSLKYLVRARSWNGVRGYY